MMKTAADKFFPSALRSLSGYGAALTFGFALALPATADEAAFAACLDQLRGDAIAAGVTATGWERHTAALEPDLSVLELLDAQPEFVTPIWDYLAALVDDERIDDGRVELQRWAEVLAAVEERYAVDAATVVAVWGVESNYGRNFGSRPLLQSLSTLSCFGRRQNFFRGEFITALRIVDEGHVAAERLTGSWAGAFGHTQFMPSTFMRLAVDFDGDGRRDLVDSVPDALASTANFLRRAGWRQDLPWGYEVQLPASLDVSGAGRRNKQPLAQWVKRGLRQADGSALPATDTAAGLLLPAGRQGPAFLVTKNFDALFSYNAAESYALAIAHLADRLRGGAAFHAPWPTDDPGLSRAQRRELQELLLARGHDIGEVDGLIGARTRAALQQEQQALGLEADGRAGLKTLRVLRRAVTK